MFNPNTYHQLTAMHMLSPEGISHTFDDRANGYGRGDGIGALIVKRLSDAIRDGDTIRAVIRGSGANADGKTPSITQPSSTAQAELINQTYEDAGLDQAETDYFECHGTGTPVGDPLELTAIASTLGAARRTAGKTPLYIGSIKPTVGHTEGCAGLAGIFKSILLLEKGLLVPTYGVERVNPKLKLADWHLALPEDTLRWPTSGMRRVSVNSFGFGGANAHVILDDAHHYLEARGLKGKHNTLIHYSDSDSGLEEDAPVDITNIKASKKLFLITGKDQAGPKRVADDLNTWLHQDSDETKDLALMDKLAFTLGMRRNHLEHRTYAVASSVEELSDKITKGLPSAIRSQRHGENLVMVFTGQGAQWPAMGQELLENNIFRQSIEMSQSYLSALGCKWDAVEELTKTEGSNINMPEYSQPLCTVVQVALIDLLRFWNILPAATIGHSSGEIAAAYAASLLSHADAIKLAYVRGVSSAAVSKKGAMMAAGLSQEEAQTYLEQVAPESAVVACVNSPSSVTLSGDVDAIDHLEKVISADGKFARKLKVTTAYHSPHMREVSPTYLGMIGNLTPKEPSETESSPVMYSSLTGKMVTSSAELNAEYWVNNMQNPVQFTQGLFALLKHKKKAPGGTRPVAVQWGGFLEVGPHAALQGPLRQIIDASNNKFAKAAPYASMLVRGKDAVDTSMSAAGALWAAGCKVDMRAINQNTTSDKDPQMLCHLPNYPWNHSRSFWHESYSSKAYRFPPHVRSDYLGMPEDAQNSHEPQWRNYLRVSENPWIEDHIITGTVLYPGAGMLVMALEGALRTADTSKTIQGYRLSNVSFERGLVVSLDEEAPLETRINFHPNGHTANSWTFTVYSMTNGSPWTKHCAGTVTIEYEEAARDVEEDNIDALWQRQTAMRNALTAESGSLNVNVDDFYTNLEKIGMQYGPVFRNTVSLTAVPSQDASYGSVKVPDTKATMPKQYESSHIIHPATLDSIFHLVLASVDAGQPTKQAVVPYSIEEIYIASDQPKDPEALYSGYGRLLAHDGHELTAELIVSDQDWTTPKLTVKNFALRQVTAGDDLDAANFAANQAVKNCASLTWIPDMNFVTSDADLQNLAKESLDNVFDSVFLKSSTTAMTVVLLDESENSLETLRRLKNRSYGPKKITAYAVSETVSKSMEAILGYSTESNTVEYRLVAEAELVSSLSAESRDIAAILGTDPSTHDMEALSNLAPIVCFTSAMDLKDVTNLNPSEKHRACFTERSTNTLVLTSAKSPSTTLPSYVALLVPEKQSGSLKAFVANTQNSLEVLGLTVEQIQFTTEEMAKLSGKTVISLLEVDAPLVYQWNEVQFTAFKTLISTVGHLFWITHGSLLESWANGVEFATSQGLLRVMRNEYPIAVLPSFDMSAIGDITSPSYSDLVLNAWKNSLAEEADMEYAERNGLVHIARATEEADFDYELQLASNTAKPVLASLGSIGKPLQATESAGSGCIWIPDEQTDAALVPGEVEVRVEYAGIRPGQKLAKVRHAVGVVTKKAEDVTSFSIGQQVVVFANSTSKTHVRQQSTLIAPLPKSIDTKQAVSMVEPFITALYTLTELARLRPGQTLLVDDAASEVGQAVIQVAQAMQTTIFALVYSKDEKELLNKQFGLPANHVFDSLSANFVSLIETLTQNRGVNVFISQRSGAHVDRAMPILGQFSQFIDISRDSSKSIVAKNNVTVSRVDMAEVVQARLDVVGNLFQQTFKDFKPQLSTELSALPLSDLASVFYKIQTESTVVSLQDDSMVLMPAPATEPLQLDDKATYVLVGGLGALGLDIANWMAEYGAKNLVFLSRSGGAKNQEDLQKFTDRGVQAEAFKCDINDALSVATVFDNLKASGRKIGGVIQLAMVLDDGIFDNMSFAQWRHAIEPKTRGSRNLLANIWPEDNPFFILLSSITGVIGNTAQANYASGNTFEDALAHYANTHLNINATSIDVGLVSDSSHFTNAGEFGDLASYLGRYQHGWKGLQTNLGELGVVMRAVMKRAITPGQRAPAQLVLGLGEGIEHNEAMGGFSKDKKFELRVVDSSASSDGDSKQDVGTLLSNATTMAEAAAAVEDNIKELVAAAMGVSLDEVDSQKPLYDYGGKLYPLSYPNTMNNVCANNVYSGFSASRRDSKPRSQEHEERYFCL